MNTRREFLRFGALFVPAAIAEPRRVYSFLWAPRQSVPIDIGALITKSLERSVKEGHLARHWARHIVIKGTVSI